MSFLGFGGSQQPAATPTSQTQFVREAPGIEERKLELMDIARQGAQEPIDLTDVQVAPLTALEQQGLTQAAGTGVGAGTVNQGIAALQAGVAPIGAAQINQFLNPFQAAVNDYTEAIYSTATNGTIVITTDGATYEVDYSNL